MKKEFGKTRNGQMAYLYTLQNKSGMKVTISDLGATVVSVFVKDYEGNDRDVVLGYDCAADYEKADTCIGALIGRNANRIANACFTLNGKEYTLVKNNFDNNLHSGLDFYFKRMWTVEEWDETHIVFSLFSPDGDQGYPGNARIQVTYTLTDEDALSMEIVGEADADTIFNLTNHSYFNLNGHDSGDVLSQKAWIGAKAYTPADEQTIPTGEIAEVEGTPMDFTKSKPLGQDIDAPFPDLVWGKGYDRNWVLDGSGYRKVASLYSEETHIFMEVFTDLPGLQLYTANYIHDEKGKGGVLYQEKHGVCFETHHFPDAVHKPHFPSPIVKCGDSYHTKTTFAFGQR